MTANWRTGYVDGWALPDDDTGAVIPPITNQLTHTDDAGAVTTWAWEAKTLKVASRLGTRSTCRVAVPDQTVAGSFRYGQNVRVNHPRFGVMFDGTILDAELERNEGVWRWNLTIMGHRWLAEKRIVSGSWSNVPLHWIVRELVQGPQGTFAGLHYPAEVYPDPGWRTPGAPSYPATITGPLGDEGVAVGTLQNSGITVEEVAFDWVPAAEILDWCAEQAGYLWWIDHLRRLQFRAPTSLPSAPEVVSLATEGIKDSIRIRDVQRKYRNRSIVPSVPYVADPVTERFAGDGSTSTFTVSGPIQRKPVVRLQLPGESFTSQRVGILGLNTGRDWYWNKGAASITQDYGAAAIPAGSILEVTFEAGRVGWLFRELPGEQATLALADPGSSGIVEELVRTPTDSRTAARDAADADLALYGTRTRVLSFESSNPGWVPGQAVTVNLPAAGITAETWTVTEVDYRHKGGFANTWQVTALEPGPTPAWQRLHSAAVFQPARVRYDGAGLWGGDATPP